MNNIQIMGVERFTNLGPLQQEHETSEHNGPWNCLLCGKLIGQPSELKQHISVHLGVKLEKNEQSESRITCDICDKWFTTTTELKIHRWTVHNVEKPPNGLCDAKSVVFVTSDWLNSLSRVGSKEKGNKCGICDKSFTRNLLLQMHYKHEHTGEKHPNQSLSEQMFSRFPHLKVSKFVYIGEKPINYKCDLCDDRFTELDKMKYHRLIHLRERPLISDIKYVKKTSTATSSTLKIHRCGEKPVKHVHSGEKPVKHVQRREKNNKCVKCKLCDQTFSSKYYLKKYHRLVHGGEKTFKCDICDKNFTTGIFLKKHRFLHFVDRPFNIKPL